ncbi:MAG: DMT family transporter [Negativicutes bacterium]|jgi:drug/metabolite transporter (DMT)-like permease|nr:DMT family transporter [Negativicutes bacterium]
MQTRANVLLLTTAAIWGLAFVAQRVGMDFIGPFTFNGIRFALGSFSLLPLIWFFHRYPQGATSQKNTLSATRMGLLAGLVLFIAASLQQIGIVYTTAGKAAFITCLYIVLVPLAGLWLRHRISFHTWAGCLLALVGLYFLCVKEDFSIAFGDMLELAGALFWTAHILLIDHISRKVDSLKLAAIQFATCAALSLAVALAIETFSLESILQAGVPILYGGIGSVGIAYTLQIIGQKNASPAHAALILSMETVFAAIGGFLLLGEILGARELTGAGLMLAGMLLSQRSQLRY